MSILSSLVVKLGLDNKEFDQGLKKSKGETSKFGSAMNKVGGVIAGALAIGKIAEFSKGLVELKGKAEGIKQAFDQLNQPDLLDKLRVATKGTVSDLELMKNAVKFKNFNLSLSEMPKYLEFARRRAKQTGESVDYLVESITVGLGRKSLMILDNLGISATDLRAEMAKTGDMAKAVSNIMKKSMAGMGEDIDTGSEKMARLGASWDNFKLALAGNTSVNGFLGLFAKGLDSLSVRLKSTFDLWAQFKASVEGVDLMKSEGEANDRSKEVVKGVTERIKAAKTEAEALKIYSDELKKLADATFKREEDFQAKLTRLREERAAAAKKSAGTGFFSDETKAFHKATKDLDDFINSTKVKTDRGMADLQDISTGNALSKINPSQLFKEANGEGKKGTGQIEGIDAEIKLLQSSVPKYVAAEDAKRQATLKRIKVLQEERKELLRIKDTEGRDTNLGPMQGKTQGSFESKLSIGELDVEETFAQLDEKIAKKKQEIADEFGSSMAVDFSGLVTGMATSLGTAIGSGDWSNIGSDLLSAFGSFLQELGAMAVAYAGLQIAIQTSMNPYVMLAAGTAAIILGAAMSAKSAEGPATTGGSSSGSASYGGGDSTANSALFNRAGQRTSGYDSSNMEQNVTFTIEGQNLVGVLRKNNMKGAL